MATILTRTWTAANGTSWEVVGFKRVVGASLLAEVQSNTGQCGSVAGERVFIVTGFPQTPGHKVAVDMDWSNAAGASRAPGVGSRWTDDGSNGYMAELDSFIGAARARIRRRRDGAWVDLTGWVDVSAFVTSAALNAGVTCELRTANEEGKVALSFRIAGTERLAYSDTSASRVEDPGAPALLIDANSTLNDVAYDSLTVKDLADEYTGDPVALAAGIALVVDGISYSWDDLDTRGVFVGRGKQSYDQGDGWEFTTAALMDAADDVLYPGAVVTVALDGVVVAFGRIQHASRKLAPGEGRAYRLVTARQLAADVDLTHPETKADSITWNLPTDHADYEAAYAGKAVGVAIKKILDTHSNGTSGLRAHLAAPPDESTAAYVQAQLDLLTAKVPGMSVSGDPVTAVEQLLAFTKYLLVIDPATLIWHFKERMAGTIVQVDVSTKHVLGEYEIDPDRNHTACVLRGSKPEITQTSLTSDALGGLEKQWPTSLEATRTDEKSVTNRKLGLVGSIGGSAGAPTMTPDTVGPPTFSMAALEWVRCRVTFNNGPESGKSFDVTTNTNLAFTLVGPWTAGGPLAGNSFTVQGNAVNGGRDNAYTEMGKRYKLSNADLGIAGDACARVKIIQNGIDKITTAKVITPTDASQPSEVVLDLPSIGIATFPPSTSPSACGTAGVATPAKVEVTLPTYNRTDPRVPRRWFPRTAGGADAYRGTAFTTDPAKWNGVGMPGRGDPGVARPYRQHAPEYDGSAAQGAEWDLVFAELLAFMGALARSVTVTVHGSLDTTCAGLGKRLQILGGPPELATTTELTILAVEWDPIANTTTYYAGTFAAGPYDVQRMREEMVARNVKRRVKRDQASLEKLRDCLDNNLHSAGYAREQPPTQLCANRVSTTDGKRLGEQLDQECVPPDGGCVQACTSFPCETVPPGHATNFQQNAAILQALRPTSKDAAGFLAYLASSLACLWKVAGGGLSSHDQELYKAFGDLGGIRLELNAMALCVNSQDTYLCNRINDVDARLTCLIDWINTTMIPTYNACFNNRVVGPGAPCAPSAPNCPAEPCELVPACSNDFTETVCDPKACQQPVPLLNYGATCVPP